MPRLVVYVRTSTDDQQSPLESRRWQLARAEQTASGRAQVVRVVHDVDVSRSIPWARRPEAARLLLQLPNPMRGWNGIIVAEPQRAFGDATQMQLVLRQLTHYKICLWVPELGGPVDPDSEAHDLLLLLFGGLSRAEINRMRVRIRAQMRAMVPEGRFLGGRPPYGYRIVPTDTAHPNPEKARWGVKISQLQPDPTAAQVVRRIFDMRSQGIGYKAIASALSADEVPSPSANDPGRNPHRRTSGWVPSAIQAIILNPKYKGTQRFGHCTKTQQLIDPADPALGHKTRMTPSATSDVILVDGLIEPIVTPEQWEAAQPGRASHHQGRPAVSGASRYSLRGLIICGKCGKRMQGQTVTRKSGRPVFGYKCAHKTTGPDGSSSTITVFVAEGRILPVLNTWLAQISEPAHLDETIDQLLAQQSSTAETSAILRARCQEAEAEARIERLLASIEAGIDPAIVATKVRSAQEDLASARATIDSIPGAPVVDATSLRQHLATISELLSQLGRADAETKRHLYETAGIRVEWDRTPDGDTITPTVHLPSGPKTSQALNGQKLLLPKTS